MLPVLSCFLKLIPCDYLAFMLLFKGQETRKALGNLRFGFAVKQCPNDDTHRETHMRVKLGVCTLPHSYRL